MSVQCSAAGRLALAWLVFFAAAAPPLQAQVPGLSPAATPAPAAPTDVLGRDTPFGTVTGFNRAVHRRDLTQAARYLQLRGRQLATAEELARDLNTLLDRYYTEPLIKHQFAAPGNQEDGLPPNRDQLSLALGEDTHQLVLERVTDPDAGQIWLFSSQSLADVPRLVASPHTTWIESFMPASLTGRSLLGASLAQWIVGAASIALPVVLFWLIGQLAIGLADARDGRHRPTASDQRLVEAAAMAPCRSASPLSSTSA